MTSPLPTRTLRVIPIGLGMDGLVLQVRMPNISHEMMLGMYRPRLRVVDVVLTTFLLSALLSACGSSSLPSSGVGRFTNVRAGWWLSASFPIANVAAPGFAVGYEAPNKDTIQVTGRLGPPETLERAGVDGAVVGCTGVDPTSAVAVPMEWAITLESKRAIAELSVQFQPVNSRSGAFLVDSLG